MSPSVSPFFLVLLLLIASSSASSPDQPGTSWCGYQPEWRDSFSTITYAAQTNLTRDNEVGTMDMETGVFTVAGMGHYYITVTATVGGMPSPAYGQIFLKKSGHVFTSRLRGGISGGYDREYGPESVDDILYALVEEDKVTDVRKAVGLRQGDTLELFAGHVTNSKIVRFTSQPEVVSGGFLEDVTFCINLQN